MENILTLEMVRITEAAALASARFMGRGDNMAADRAATEAMRRTMDEVEMRGRIVIGEGERDEAPMLFIGEEVGHGGPDEPEVDIAVDPLEGTNLVAHGQGNAITVLAASEHGGLLHAPDTYLEKLCVGPIAAGHVDIRRSASENVVRVAAALGRRPSDITVVILDRPRHADLIAAIRKTGAGIRLISDGDVAGVIFTTKPDETGIDIYLGIGAAPEGVLAAGALRCIGGQMQGRLILDTEEKRTRAAGMGVTDPERKYDMTDLARGDVIVAATGVTDGALLEGVRFGKEVIETETIVYRSATGTVRKIRAEHRELAKFHLD